MTHVSITEPSPGTPPAQAAGAGAASPSAGCMAGHAGPALPGAGCGLPAAGHALPGACPALPAEGRQKAPQAAPAQHGTCQAAPGQIPSLCHRACAGCAENPPDSPATAGAGQAPRDAACSCGSDHNIPDRSSCLENTIEQKTANRYTYNVPVAAPQARHQAGQPCQPAQPEQCGQCGQASCGRPCTAREGGRREGCPAEGERADRRAEAVAKPFPSAEGGGQARTCLQPGRKARRRAKRQGAKASAAGTRKGPLALLACAGILLGSLQGCAHRDAPSEASIRAQEARFERMASSRSFEVADGAYLGCSSVPLADESAPELQRRVRCKCRGSLAEAVRILQEISPVAISLQAGDAGRSSASAGGARGEARGGARGARLKAGELAEPRLEDLLGQDLAELAGAGAEGEAGVPPLVLDSAPEIVLDYEGPFRGLLDRLCAQAGLGWDYERASQTVTLAHTLVRTFTVHATAGAVASESRITNRTRDQESASVSAGSAIRQTARTSTADAQTAQTASTKLAYDAWQEVVNAVKALLSPRGKVTASQAAGTITVCDHPDSVRRAGRVVADFNARFERQCALRVNVYALELKDESSAGLDLQLLFQKASGADLAVQAGSLALAGATGTTQAAVVKGDLKGSAGVLQALKAYGTATQVTSGGLVVRSGCPAPLQAIRKTGYLAGVASETTQYGQTTSVTPGEVSTGFAMTILPHILEGRRIALACTVHLSSLEALREYRSGSAVVQLPQTSSRAFQQSATLQAGQTLVLAGFQQAGQDADVSAGLLSASRSARYSRSILIITIEVEMAPPGEAGLAALRGGAGGRGAAPAGELAGTGAGTAAGAAALAMADGAGRHA